MKKLLPVLFSITLFSGLSAYAGQPGKVQLLKSTPASDSVSTSAPSAFILEFSEGVRMHEVFIKKDDGKSSPIGNLPTRDAKTITIPAPALTAGHYVLDWAVFTQESRVLRGRVPFTVSAGNVAASVSAH